MVKRVECREMNKTLMIMMMMMMMMMDLNQAQINDDEEHD